jgi:hypothetical protein
MTKSKKAEKRRGYKMLPKLTPTLMGKLVDYAPSKKTSPQDSVYVSEIGCVSL